MPDDVIRILVVDDHPVFVRGLLAVLADVPDVSVIGAVGTGREAIDIATSANPDVILLDLNVPDGNGIEVATRLRDQDFTGAILVLTMYDDETALTAALTAGARGYLLKGATQAEITAGVRSVHAGGMVFGAPVAARIAQRVTTVTASRIPELTARECDVLALIADGYGNPRIAQRLFLSDKTVRNYITSIFTKLGVTDRQAAIAVAHRAGITRHRSLPWEQQP